MKDLLILIAKNLVETPDEVDVDQDIRDDGALILKLKVAEGDMGKVIGKQGRIARAIRTVIKAAAIHEGKKVVVEIAQ